MDFPLPILSLREMALEKIINHFVDVSLTIIARETWKPNCEPKIEEIIHKIQKHYQPYQIYLHQTSHIGEARQLLKNKIFEKRKRLRSKETRLRLWFWECFEHLQTQSLKLTCLCKPTYSPWSHKVFSIICRTQEEFTHLTSLCLDDIADGKFKDHDYDPWFQRIPIYQFKDFFAKLPNLQYLELSDELLNVGYLLSEAIWQCQNLKNLRISMIDIDARAFCDYVNKSSKSLELLEFQGPKSYLDMETVLNSLKQLKKLKTLSMASEMCKPSERQVSLSQPLPNSSVRDLWIRLSCINSLELVDLFFQNMSNLHISASGRIDMRRWSNHLFLPEYKHFSSVKSFELLANYATPSSPINLLSVFTVFPNLEELKINDCDCGGDSTLAGLEDINEPLPLIESMKKLEVTGIIRDLSLLLRLPNLEYFKYETWTISNGTWIQFEIDGDVQRYLPKNCKVEVSKNHERLRSMATPDSVASFDYLLGSNNVL